MNSDRSVAIAAGLTLNPGKSRFYESFDNLRFDHLQKLRNDASCRLVKPSRESNGKKYGSQNSKIGNVHLKWAFSEASIMFISKSEEGKKYLQKLEKKFEFCFVMKTLCLNQNNSQEKR